MTASVWFSQLYGMSDNISFNLAEAGYNVSKYVPYGPVKAVMPYLVQHAQRKTLPFLARAAGSLSLIQE